MAPTNQLLTESHFGNRDNSSNVNVNFPGNITTGIAMGSGNSSGVPSTNDMVKTVLMNTSAMNSLDLLIPISPAPVKVCEIHFYQSLIFLIPSVNIISILGE